MNRQHPGETYRAAIEARCPIDGGGDICTVLVRCVNGRVQLLHHAVPSTGAKFTDDQVDDVVAMLTAAKAARRGSGRETPQH